jgi:hypothetical protein
LEKKKEERRMATFSAFVIAAIGGSYLVDYMNKMKTPNREVP